MRATRVERAARGWARAAYWAAYWRGDGTKPGLERHALAVVREGRFKAMFHRELWAEWERRPGMLVILIRDLMDRLRTARARGEVRKVGELQSLLGRFADASASGHGHGRGLGATAEETPKARRRARQRVA